jgi:hypothetical protein
MKEHVLSLLAILVWAAALVLAVFLIGTLNRAHRHEVDAMERESP